MNLDKHVHIKIMHEIYEIQTLKKLLNLYHRCVLHEDSPEDIFSTHVYVVSNIMSLYNCYVD